MLVIVTLRSWDCVKALLTWTFYYKLGYIVWFCSRTWNRIFAILKQTIEIYTSQKYRLQKQK